MLIAVYLPTNLLPFEGKGHGGKSLTANLWIGQIHGCSEIRNRTQRSRESDPKALRSRGLLNLLMIITYARKALVGVWHGFIRAVALKLPRSSVLNVWV